MQSVHDVRYIGYQGYLSLMKDIHIIASSIFIISAPKKGFFSKLVTNRLILFL